MAGANPLAKVPMWCKKCKVVFQTELAGGENYTSSNRLRNGILQPVARYTSAGRAM
jgi:hypothetical protein